jgi:hypothetical protein
LAASGFNRPATMSQKNRRWIGGRQSAVTTDHTTEIETGKISQMEAVELELIDVAPGLWLWQVQYREWPRDHGWDGKVVSTCVESGGEIALIDPLALANEPSVLWDRLGARPPKFIVILKPDHVRDVVFFARRYNIRAFGPKVFHRNDVPETELEYIYPGLT